ncbi:MAG TPA: hypothetical protein VL326_35905 [Kofleriaceae bacterium]|nr:hypothetical protein [Kofleriaceae bacterium]
MRPVFLLLFVSIVGCKDHQPEATANAAPPPHTSAPTLAAKTDVAAKTGGPVKTTPRDLFADFTKPDADGLALLDKYRDGATFTGMLKTVGEDETGRPVLMMDVDGRNIISLDFADATAGKGHKQGESLTVTCKIGGASGALMMVTDCVL